MIFKKEIFTSDNFDSNLIKEIGNRLENLQYSDSLKVALLYLTHRIREKTGLADLDGDKLVTKAFNPNNPLIKINNLETESEKNEQKGIMFILQGIYSAFRNPLNHTSIIINEDECIRKLIIIDTILSYVNINNKKENLQQNILFDKVSKESLDYYLIRDIDKFTIKTLSLNNLWIYGESGIGKTNVALRYIINEKRNFYHSLYFATVQTIDDAFQFIFEELVDRLENDNLNLDFKNTDSNIKKIKKLFCIISNNYETVTLHFDEIYDFAENEFHKIFIFLVDVLKNNSVECNFSNFNIIITTIINPLDFITSLERESDIEKINELFIFKKMELWNDNELTNLFNLINLHLESQVSLENKIIESKNKPRKLKKLIKKEIIG